MSKFREYLLKAKESAEAYLIDDNERDVRSKDDYIHNAEEGLIVAFRLNFSAKSGLALTKVISGKILENNKEDEVYVVETRNGLKYCVPFAAVVWVKTGGRWPKGVYDEMKQGSTPVDENTRSKVGIEELGELESIDEELE
jgi:hypothetical protein